MDGIEEGQAGSVGFGGFENSSLLVDFVADVSGHATLYAQTSSANNRTGGIKILRFCVSPLFSENSQK